jgi:methanogenic corrinoid protein MtbC1
MRKPAGDPTKNGYPIQVVARRTGLSPDVIRVWERRYRVVLPERTKTGRRLYSEDDVKKLVLLQSALAGGRRIGDVAGLSPNELEEMVRLDRTRGPFPTVKEPTEDNSLKECLEAVRNLDADGLQTSLARAAAGRGAELFAGDVVGPLMREVGDLWLKGFLDPYHEHFAASAVKKALQEIMGAATGRPDAPWFVVCTPAGQHHEIGALMAGALAAIQGWRVLYLGPNLPAVDIAKAASRTGAKAVGLSVIYPVNDPSLREELETLGRLLPQDATLLVGGAAVAGLSDIRGVIVPDIASLPGVLSSIRDRLPDENQP